MKITWITFGSAGSPSSASRRCPASSPRSRSSRPRSTGRAGRAGCSASAALLGAGLTAFYMTRLFVLTFHGPKRWTEDIKHPHESPPVMTIPLILLAVGSVGAGFLMSTSVVDWLTPVFGGPSGPEYAPVLAHWPITAAVASASPCSARGLGWALFRNGTALAGAAGRPGGHRGPQQPLRRRVQRGRLRNARPYLTRALVYLDNKGIDGLVNGLAAAGRRGSGRLRRLQTGFVRSYALSMLGGACWSWRLLGE